MRALITGAGSGMGMEMALYLESLGYDLYVVDRKKEKLDKIYKNCKNKVTTIEMDLSNSDNGYKLYEELKNENIDILINNAGFGDYGEFVVTSLDKELEMINVNIKAYHILMKLFLKDFVARDYGRILNVASISGFMPGAYMATYYATKSYIINLSLGVMEELRQKSSNVKISVFCPGPVCTNFTKRANVDFNINSLSKEYASKVAIDGMFENKLIIIPNNMKLSYILLKVMPIELIMLITSFMHKSINE